MRDENYILIPGWAVNKLNLKGNDLMVFSIIHGFSQDGESEFSGTIRYLCEGLNISRPTVMNALQALTKAGYILKRTEKVDGVEMCRYRVSPEVLAQVTGTPVKKVYGDPVKEVYTSSKENLLDPSKESLHNNNTNNIKTNIYSKNKERLTSSSLFSTEQQKKESKTEIKTKRFLEQCSSVVSEFDFDNRVQDKLFDFFTMLAQQGTFFPRITIQAQLEELHKFITDEQLTIISETIRSGWKSLRYSAEKIRKQSVPSFDTAKPGAFQPKDPKNDRRAELYKDDEVF